MESYTHRLKGYGVGLGWLGSEIRGFGEIGIAFRNGEMIRSAGPVIGTEEAKIINRSGRAAKFIPDRMEGPCFD